MTLSHAEVGRLLAAVALDAADPDETAAVEEHARTCRECHEELAGLRAAAGLLAVAHDEFAPPPSVRSRVMDAVRAESEVPASPRPERETARSWRPRWRFLTSPWPAAAVGLAVVAVALFAWNVALRADGPGPRQQQTVAVTGTVDAPGVSGRMTLVADAGAAVVSLRGLEPLPAGDAYQLWTIADGTPRSAGVFDPGADGDATVLATGIAGAETIALTAQPRTHTRAPEGPLMMVAPVPA